MKLMYLRITAVTFALCCLLTTTAQTTKGKPSYETYFHTAELPDASVYLPAPPDTSSVAFVDDFMQWVWGKSVRNTLRGIQASDDSYYGAGRLAQVFGDAIGIRISRKETPAMWRLIHRVGETGNKATNLAKRKYMRRRPFMVMNERTWGKYDDEADLRPNGSFPSGHTGFGWSAALAMAEVAPEAQDTLLRKGYEYGESRVIVGAHWQSDVDAGYMAASAAWARMHTSSEYINDLKEAKAEYRRIKGIKTKKVEAEYPRVERVMNLPSDSSTFRMYGDWSAYWLSKSVRETERGQEAVEDADCTEESFMNCFSPCVKMTLSEKDTPQIAELMKKVFAELCVVSGDAKDATFRTRPFARMGESSGIEELNDHYLKSSSFPSAHSMLGWGLALALVEVMPDCQNELLLRGYEYGRSRTILGLHFESDVKAGRVMAACALARMHADTDFLKMMEEARKEYTKLKKRQN